MFVVGKPSPTPLFFSGNQGAICWGDSWGGDQAIQAPEIQIGTFELFIKGFSLKYIYIFETSKVQTVPILTFGGYDLLNYGGGPAGIEFWNLQFFGCNVEIVKWQPIPH